MLKNLLIMFILIFVYKIFTNIVNLIKISYYYSLYEDFITDKSNEITKHKNHVVDLFKKAKITNDSFAISQYSGCNTISNGHTSIFTAFPTKDYRFITPTLNAFQNAIGIFRGRIIESFNPKYWIDCLLFLPKNTLTYLNVSAESLLIKFFQVIYWLIGIACSLFSDDISNFIKSFFVR